MSLTGMYVCYVNFKHNSNTATSDWILLHFHLSVVFSVFTAFPVDLEQRQKERRGKLQWYVAAPDNLAQQLTFLLPFLVFN